ncbi:MAG: nucleoside phosphorylase [Candidatus Thorarchaeota archaeon]
MPVPLFFEENPSREESVTSPRKTFDYRGRKEGLPPLKLTLPSPLILAIGPFFDLIKDAADTTAPLEPNLPPYDPAPLQCHFGAQICALFPAWWSGPRTAIQIEDLNFFGMNKIIFLGFAGSIHPSIAFSTVVVPNEVVREDGTSYHYAAKDAPIGPSPASLALQEKVLEESGISFKIGPTWCTDAGYRETPSKIRQLSSQGVLAVEMEAGALFAVSAFRDIEAVAFYLISDELFTLEWHQYWHEAVERSGKAFAKAVGNFIQIWE